MEIEDASRERELRERKGRKSAATPARRGKKREITSSSEEEVEEPEYVEDDTENENQKAAKASHLGRRGKPSMRKIKSSNNEKDTATQKEKEVAESSKSRERKSFTTKSPERSPRPRGRRSRIEVEDSVSKDAESADILDASENQNSITTTGENQKTSYTADTARTTTASAVARERPKRAVGNSGDRKRSLSKDNSVYDFGDAETGPPASPTRKSGRTRTSTAKFAKHVVDRYDATSRQQLRRGAKDRCKESLQEQSESDVDAVMHEVTIALPVSESKVVQSRPSGRRSRQQLQEEPVNPTGGSYSSAATGEEVLLVPSATEVRAENELEETVDGENKDKVDEEAAQGEETMSPKASTPARPHGGGRGRRRLRGRGGRGRTTKSKVVPAQLDEKMEVKELRGDESIGQTVEESMQPSNGGITTQEHSPTNYPAEYQFAEEGPESSIAVVQESLKRRGGARSQRATRHVQSGCEAEATGSLGELPVVAVDNVTTVNDVTVQPMSGRRSKRQTAALSALKSRALLEEHSDSDASMSTRQSSRSRSSVGRTETPPRATSRSTGRRGRTTRAAGEHEEQPSTTTEEYNNDSDSDTQGKRKRKAKTKLSLRQRNARRKKGSTGSLDLEPEVNEPEVPEGVEENFQHHHEEQEGMAEGNKAERNEAVCGGEEQNDNDNEENKDDDASLPLAAAANVTVKNLPLKMRIRISRMTDEEIERLSNRSDMEDSVTEKPIKKSKGRKARTLREKSEQKLASQANSARFQDAIQDADTANVENNNASGNGNEGKMEEDAKNKEEDESGSVANDKPEFSSNSEKEGDAIEEGDVDRDNNLVWKTADEEKGAAEEGTELPMGESAPPAEDGARTTAGGRRATGGSRRGRGARGRKGRPPSKRARVEESPAVTISDSD